LDDKGFGTLFASFAERVFVFYQPKKPIQGGITMMYFFVKDGKVEWLSEEEFTALGPAKNVQEVTEGMTPEELEAFKKERYERFIKPMMNHNIQELKNQKEKSKGHEGIITRRKSWIIDPDRRKNK
jgi:hypothetical protein